MRAQVRGENRWTLSFIEPAYPERMKAGDGGVEAPLQVVSAGYGDIDSGRVGLIGGVGAGSEGVDGVNRSGANTLHDGGMVAGRRTFGKFKKNSEVLFCCFNDQHLLFHGY